MEASATGHAKLTLFDQLKSTFLSGLVVKHMLVISVLFSLALVGIKVIVGGDRLVVTILPSAISGGVFLAFALALTMIFHTIWFYRLSEKQRTLTWEIDDVAFSLTDATGSKFVLPWTNVKAIRERKNDFMLLCRPSGSRWVPKRAFDEAGISYFRDIASRY